MTSRCLVTGAAGFVGRHLIARLVDLGHEVIGLEKPGVLTDGTPAQVHWVAVDLLDPRAVQDAIGPAAPDVVYHLAALTRGDSFEELLRTNVLGTANLLEALLLRPNHRVERVLVATSAAEYGLVREDDLPVSENQPLRPLSAYGLSKAAQFLLAQQYHLRHSLPISQTRTFNLSGPGEPPSLAGGAFAKQIAEIEVGLKDPVLSVGNLSSERDFIDIRDAVRGLIAVCELGKAGEVYNLCSGEPRTIDSVLRALLARSTSAIQVVQDPSRFTTSDVPRMYGNPRRVCDATGWKPTIPFEQTLDDLLSYWRRRVSSSRGG